MMIRYLVILFLLLQTINAFQVEAVDNNKISTKNILVPYTDTKIVKAMPNKIIPPYDSKIEEQKEKEIAQAKLREKSIKKQFIKSNELKITKVKKVDVKVEKESIEFFDSINSKDNKPINME